MGRALAVVAHLAVKLNYNILVQFESNHPHAFPHHHHKNPSSQQKKPSFPRMGSKLTGWRQLVDGLDTVKTQSNLGDDFLSKPF